MRTNLRRTSSVRGFSLVEVGIAMFIIILTAIAGFSYYSAARMSEINEWHEQNALFTAEREVEAWQENGYTALAGFTGGDCGATNFLPYGYRFGVPDAAWNQTGRFKPVDLDGFNYRVRCHCLFTANGTNDYYVQDTWNGVTYYYRDLQIVIQWGEFSGTSSTWEMTQQTRMAR